MISGILTKKGKFYECDYQEHSYTLNQIKKTESVDNAICFGYGCFKNNNGSYMEMDNEESVPTREQIIWIKESFEVFSEKQKEKVIKLLLKILLTD